MKTYNGGVVGSGFMGKAHTYAYKAIPFFYGELPIKVKLKTWILAYDATHEERHRG